jgi:hypothetical protein
MTSRTLHQKVLPKQKTKKSTVVVIDVADTSTNVFFRENGIKE